MALINWDNSYSVNIADIDRQHKKLIQIINDLHEAMGQGKGKEIAGPIIREVVSYTKTHFRNEEGYLERFGYPQTAAHKLKHVDFVDRIAKFEEDFKSRRLGLSLDLMKFLKDWLLTHIKGTDMRYAPFLIERGVR